MGDFTAHLELPSFIPKEEIMKKQVFDSEVVSLGRVQDWTYLADGEIKMIVKRREGTDTLVTFIPFSHIERVGEFILLKTKGDKYKVSKQRAKEKRQERNSNSKKREDEDLKYFDEIKDSIS